MSVPAYKVSSCATSSIAGLSLGHGCTKSSDDGLSSFAVCPDDAKQDPVMYGAEFGVVFLAKGPRASLVQ